LFVIDTSLRGEDQDEDVLWRQPDVADEMRDAEGDKARLARTRARKHRQGHFGGKCRLMLNVVGFTENSCQSFR